MSSLQKAELTNDMSRAVLEARFLNLQREHPAWTQRQLLRHFCEILYGPELARQVYP